MTKRLRENEIGEGNLSKIEYPSNFFLKFPCYFLAWLWLYKKKEENFFTKKRIEVHEIILVIPSTDDSSGNSVEDRRRIFFVVQEEILAFIFMCDEFVDKKMTYVSYLEKSGFGDSYVKPVLASYAQYISLVCSDWKLSIWADPPNNNGSFFFRNKIPDTINNKPTNELHLMYKAILLSAGYKGENYSWRPNYPPLPNFGKKADERTTDAFNNLITIIQTKVDEFNEQFFRNTYQVNLIRPSNITIHPQSVIDSVGCPDASRNALVYWKNLYDNMITDVKTDFSTISSAKDSTRYLIDKMRKIRGNYFQIDFKKLKQSSNGRVLNKYSSLVR
jgi:hypothetical protein